MTALAAYLGLVAAVPCRVQAQAIVLEPVGPRQSPPIGPEVNRPPITFLPERARPSRAPGLASWKSMRDAGVVRQAFDYSCGSAALATLLAGAGDPVSEPEILKSVLDGLDEEARRRTMAEGLTLLDLKRVATARGHRAEGYRVRPEILTRLDRPVIVYIEPDGYRHFAVMKGVVEDRVFLADPARGNVRIPVWRFLDIWQDATGEGVVFVVDAGSESALTLSQDVDPRPELPGIRQGIFLSGPRFWHPDSPIRSFFR